MPLMSKETKVYCDIAAPRLDGL